MTFTKNELETKLHYLQQELIEARSRLTQARETVSGLEITIEDLNHDIDQVQSQLKNHSS